MAFDVRLERRLGRLEHRVRNVPEDVHRALKARAAQEGRTMSDLILSELPRLAHKPSPEQLLERIRSRAPVGGPSASQLIHHEREPC